MQYPQTLKFLREVIEGGPLMKHLWIVFKAIPVIALVAAVSVHVSTAHPQLLNLGADSTPAPGSTVKLSQMPDRVTLVFNEELVPERSYMVLQRNHGSIYADKGDPTVDLEVADRNVIWVTVDKTVIESGLYTVHYIVFSGPDRGITVGKYEFEVVSE